MKSKNVFDLLSHLTAKLKNTESDSVVNVVTIGVSRADHAMPLFEAFCAVEGGIYMSVDSKVPDLTGNIDADLKRCIESNIMLDLARDGVSLEVEIVETDSTIQTLVNGQIPPETGAHRTVANFISTLISISQQSKEGRQLACIVIKDVEFDRQIKDIVWRFITNHLPLVDFTDLKTLIVLVDSEYIAASPYLDTNPSINYVLDDSQLTIRRPASENMRLIANVFEKSIDSYLVLFLGAGFSYSSDLPLGNTLRDYALKRMLHANAITTSDQLARKFRTLLFERSRLDAQEAALSEADFIRTLTLERVMVEELRMQGNANNSHTLKYFEMLNEQSLMKRGASVLRLREMIRKSNRKMIIVTVNFDTLLEDELDDKIEKFSTLEEFAEAASYIPNYLKDGGKVPYLKLHGTIENKMSVVADLGQTTDAMPLSMKQALDTLIPVGRDNVPWVYIGCSMRDRDLETYFKTTEFVSRTDEHWIGPNIDQTVRAFAETPRRRYWSRNDLYSLEERCITEVSDVFINYLSELWLSEDDNALG